MSDKCKKKKQPSAVMKSRECGGCTSCCTIFAIPDVTLRGEKCEHECEAGCAIYSTRPASCYGFACGWIEGWGDDAHRPDRLGWMVYSEPTFPHFSVFAGAGSRRRHPVCIRELGSKSDLDEPFLQKTIREFVEARAAVLVMGDDEKDGRWVSLYGPRLPDGLVTTFVELDRLAGAAAPRCILCGSKLKYEMTHGYGWMACTDTLKISCVVKGPSVAVEHGMNAAVARYHAWATSKRVVVEEKSTEDSSPDGL